MRLRFPALLSSVLGLLLLSAGIARSDGRTIVLGFDGMDPELTETWMADGTLPNFARLARQGSYHRLPTTLPPQSPVAWASFVTGLAPGAHGLFDFLARNPLSYAPEYAIARSHPPQHAIDLFGWHLPLDAGTVESRRSGTPFWFAAVRRGLDATVLQVPTTWPPEAGGTVLSGMGVPDLLGTQGTWTIYATRPAPAGTEQGRWFTVTPVAGRIETRFEGPPHPLANPPDPLALPLAIEDAGAGRVRVELAGKRVELAPGSWSEWMELRFPFAGLFSLSGLVRLHLVQGFPDLLLYVSPIQPDPRDPVVALSHPDEYAAELAARIGLFHTIGMPEETSSLNAEVMSDAAWLEMVRTLTAERERLLLDTLERQKRGLIVMVFVQTDRVSHMFWRGLDRDHPRHADMAPEHREAIRSVYREADRILARVMAETTPEDRLIVLSDHGFANYRRSVHLNRWLVEEGFMATKPGQPASERLFSNVDWTRTRAYALGFNGIFLNLRGREALGIVRPEEVAELKQRIRQRLEALVDPVSGRRVVARVYDGAEAYPGPHGQTAPDLVVGYAPDYRASWQTALGGVPEGPVVVDNDRKWSGDHLIDPPAVPGVLFTSFPLPTPPAGIWEVGGLVRASLAAQYPELARPLLPAGELGLFDLPAPLLTAVDRGLAGLLPEGLRVVLWSSLAAVLSMLVYRLLSSQRRLQALRAEAAAVRRQLASFEGEFAALLPLLGRNLSLSLRQLALTFPPAVLAGLPVIFVLAFLSNAFDARLPQPGERVVVTVTAEAGRQLPPLVFEGAEVRELAPGRFELLWPPPGGQVAIRDSTGDPLALLPPAAPVRSLHPRAWWNAFIGNPAGYLPAPSEIATITLELPQPRILPFGPDWLAGWLVPTLTVMVVVSLALKRLWRLA
ncbi:hypothetical protein HRbin40_02459 [bacterium HR40]|nr:hypothetical protein HRbin40_02459 [bacterium HR40]